MGKELRILTPTNFSIRAASALEYAAFLAKKLGATLLLSHILPDLPPAHAAGRNKKSALALEQDAAYWRGKGYAIETLLLYGDRAPQIARTAVEWHCRLIVMGLSSQRRIKDYMVGSLAERVIRLSRIPVLVVKERGKKAKANPEPAWKSQDVLEGGIGEAALGAMDINRIKT